MRRANLALLPCGRTQGNKSLLVLLVVADAAVEVADAGYP
jgi:hypothetical protein